MLIHLLLKQRSPLLRSNDLTLVCYICFLFFDYIKTGMNYSLGWLMFLDEWILDMAWLLYLKKVDFHWGVKIDHIYTLSTLIVSKWRMKTIVKMIQFSSFNYKFCGIHLYSKNEWNYYEFYWDYVLFLIFWIQTISIFLWHRPSKHVESVAHVQLLQSVYNHNYEMKRITLKKL